MSWIKDVREDIKNLDTSVKSLRNFGLTVGLVFIALAALLYWRQIWSDILIFFAGFGALLVLSGTIYAKILKPVYLLWMGIAMVIGWFVSRIILTLLFYVVITPIGLLARVMRKEFLDKQYKNKKETYWIKKANPVIDYKKMH